MKSLRSLFAFVLAVGWMGATFGKPRFPCDPNSRSTARYRLRFKGTWDEENFPKQYPKYRPPAQWSKLIGRSHNEDYRLWSKGLLATPGMKKMAELGVSDPLEDTDIQGFNGLLDTFATPPMDSGVGSVSVDFFVRSNFTKVSTATRIVPSPDWFVGVDSTELCQNGSWVTALNIALNPMDAGTDRGFTFTSPNWETRPQEPVYAITSSFPSHRANSFYYPNLKKLPQIAQVTFTLLDVARHQFTIQSVTHKREMEGNSAEEEEVMAKRREELEEKLILAGEPIGESEEEEEEEEVAPPPPPPTPRRRRRPRTRNYQRDESRRDCVVGEWEDWSPCSKTCGFGVQKRRRPILQVPNRGRPCPQLQMEKWCGSMRTCRKKTPSKGRLFAWLAKGKDTKSGDETTSRPSSSYKSHTHTQQPRRHRIHYRRHHQRQRD